MYSSHVIWSSRFLREVIQCSISLQIWNRLSDLVRVMTTQLPFVFRWGIISTGNISTAFVKVSEQVLDHSWMTVFTRPPAQDILLDPKT
jgi:hypothetical protein